MRVRFRNLSDSRAFRARIDELLSVLSPSEDEYAAILRHAREIGEGYGARSSSPARSSRAAVAKSIALDVPCPLELSSRGLRIKREGLKPCVALTF
jgi:hypothetical protein